MALLAHVFRRVFSLVAQGAEIRVDQGFAAVDALPKLGHVVGKTCAVPESWACLV